MGEGIAKTVSQIFPILVLQLDSPEKGRDLAHGVRQFALAPLTFFERRDKSGRLSSFSTEILKGNKCLRIPIPWRWAVPSDKFELSYRRTNFQKTTDHIREDVRITIENKEALDPPPLVIQVPAFRHGVFEVESSHPFGTCFYDPHIVEFHAGASFGQSETLAFTLRYNLSSKPRVVPAVSPAPREHAHASEEGEEEAISPRHGKAPATGRTGGILSFFSK